MSHDPLIGQRLNNFRVDRLIGRGGMARVYYGWDMHLDRPVAIKVIDTWEESSLSATKRLIREARSIARWRHENIVQVYHADSQEGLYYFVMEYVEGLDLSQLLAQYADEGVLMPPDDVLRIGWAVAKALDYAHSQGIIHRDVKPSNVLAANDGRIVLTDFGLALDVQQGTLGEVFGTPHYISPEQAVSSTNAVAQSDLYSLGVMLYEMLAGRIPFDDPSPISLALLHVNEPPPLPTTINPDLNIPTEAVLLKALSKEPHERYQSAADLMESLERALHAERTAPHRRSGNTTMISSSSIDEIVAAHMSALQAASAVDASAGPPPDSPPRTLNPRRTPAKPPRRASGYTIPAALIAAGSMVGIAILVATALIVATNGDPPAPIEQSEATSPPASGGVNARETADALLLDPALEPSPSSTPTLQATEGSVVLPVQETPSLTMPPTLTETPTESPAQPAAPTVLYPDGYRLVLIYTDIAFYLWNPGDRTLDVRSVDFEAVSDLSGEPTAYRFRGRQWAEIYGEIRPRHCDAIEIMEGGHFNRPADCQGYNATRTPPRASEQIFWLPREGASQFRILWDGQEIARCGVAAGRCEVYIP